MVLVAMLLFVWGLVSLDDAQAAGEYEPNDSLTQTAGPLAGDVNYDASAETDNDVDWYRFYVRGQTQLRVTATGLLAEDDDDYSECDLDLRDRSGATLNGTYVESDYVSEINQTLHQAGVYFLVAECYQGSRYRINLSPAQSIVANDACGIALTQQGPAARDVLTAYGKVKALEKRLANAKGKHAKARLRAKLRSARGLLATSQAVLAEIEGRIAANC